MVCQLAQVQEVSTRVALGDKFVPLGGSLLGAGGQQKLIL